MTPRVVVCPYCKQNAVLVTGAKIYPVLKELHENMYWRCDPCDAHVGCHKDKNAKPLGTLANVELRQLRIRLHWRFDKLWKEHGWDRKEAYKWLSERLEISKDECHIGMFDVDRCQRARALLSEAGY